LQEGAVEGFDASGERGPEESPHLFLDGFDDLLLLAATGLGFFLQASSIRQLFHNTPASCNVAGQSVIFFYVIEN